MPRLRHGRPVWRDHPAPPKRSFPPQRGDLNTDVVIVGGGITGAICAYLFAAAGVRVALLEARKIARGSTIASTALLMQEPDRDFGDLARRFGRSTTRDIWKLLARATRDFSRTIKTLKLPADLCECDSVYFTLDPRKVPALRKELAARKRAGLPGRWLSAAALYRKTGIHAEGAILTRGNAQVNPIRACHGFIAAAARRGAKIFERSAARGIATSERGVEIRTSRGVVTARTLVVATGYATPEFRGLVGRFTLKDTFVVATGRLPPRSRKPPVMAWDMSRPYHYLRWTDDGRLLVGGDDTLHRSAKHAGQRIARARVQLRQYLAEVHPDLADVNVEYSWAGLFAETPDGLPYIGAHSRYPRHLFALGYGGNGMTASFLAAQTLLDLYQRGDKGRKAPRSAVLFAFQRGRR